VVSCYSGTTLDLLLAYPEDVVPAGVASRSRK
jgi:hypothetical protein